MSNGNGNGNGKENFIKRKFLFVSWESLSGDLAWNVQQEGHEVKVYIKEPDDGDVFEGMLERVEDWKAMTDWADVIVFDDVGFGSHADRLRSQGKLVVGGSEYTDRLEDDREFGQEEMKRVGMLTLPGWAFNNYDEAIGFISEHPGRYVYKPSGFVSSDWKGLLFIGKEDDGGDLIEILSSNKSVLEKKIKQFQLQKYAAGVEVAVGAFFNGHDFIYPINVNFEHKKLFNGEIGPFTGEMGTLMFWAYENPIFKATLERMLDGLRNSKYVGYVDINCIVNTRGIYPLEFTCRFGYPTISIQLEGIQSPVGEFLYAIASGQTHELKTKKGFQIGVCCVVPPFPYSDKHELGIYKDLSILFKKPNMDGVHFGDVKTVDGKLRIAGATGYALVITGSGTTVEDARKQAYSRVDNIMLQNMYYRTDIGLRWNEDGDRLLTWGYLFK